ncbi:MAG: ABC transporter ATP-binding protein [Puniceicoccales bacterium]|jgi:ABC-type lipoprotein export system ATPase subunit|nr:ABC transporter ATP-binding protein [Puniceicoccales bacterium]
MEISLENVSKRYGSGANKVIVIDNLNLKIKIGERLAILGVSGSGKTTLLHIIGGLLPPDSGKVLWGGVNANGAFRRNEKLRGAFFGFSLQNHALLEELNVLENVLLPLKILGKKKNISLAEELLAAVSMDHRMRSVPNMLSGGEKQRVAIARALIHQPSFLIADEPTGNLDEETAEAVIEYLFNLCKIRHTGLLYVTHNRQFAYQGQRVFFLRKGKLEEVPHALQCGEKALPNMALEEKIVE